MCWSYEISCATATLEAGLLLLITTRAFRSSEPRFGQQLALVPLLSSSLLVEVIEGALWRNENFLRAIQEADEEGSTCPKRNELLTLAIWMTIWCQPYAVIFAARKSGSPTNNEALQISQYLSVLFATVAVGMYLHSAQSAVSPTVPRLGESQFRSYRNRETCTYIGLHGHLHWTVAMTETILTPNAFAYAMLFLSTIFARPKHVVAVPSLIMMLIFVLQSIWFEGTFEAGSMWCFAAIIVFVYYAVQPWVWRCSLEDREHMYQLLPVKRPGGET